MEGEGFDGFMALSGLYVVHNELCEEVSHCAALAQVQPLKIMEITPLLVSAVHSMASDLHLSAGLPPAMRVDGDMRFLDSAPLDADTLGRLLSGIMSEAQWVEFTAQREIDFSFAVSDLGRFRANVFTHERGLGAVLRTIPGRIPSLDELGTPAVLTELAQHARGLILVTGPTGSGKSTTLAAMIDYLNTHFPQHILTIEDPIEYLHASKKSLISQREVHRDTLSFNAALRAALREDPDVILVGELRDLETIRLALTAAETGHLVFGTLHTASAPKTIDRIVDVFPASEKSVIRSMLAESLLAVISQVLVKQTGGGRTAAFEIMVGTPAIRNLIREDKVSQMYSAMQTGRREGMQTLDQCLVEWVEKGRITREEARIWAVNKAGF